MGGRPVSDLDQITQQSGSSERLENDFVINVATVNGSGSQSANNVLLKSLFRMGIPVGGKNVFPSNIAGLPTWFWIRANKNGYLARRSDADIVVAMNPQTIVEDTKTLRSGGVFVYNADIPFDATKVRTDISLVPVPFRKLSDQVTDSVKVKKLVMNIIYVGILAELLKIDEACLFSAIEAQLGAKQSVFEVNKRAMEIGIQYARESLSEIKFPFVAKQMDATAGKILIEGNTSSALGLMFGGAGFASWYPITPSSSVMENFIKFTEKYRHDGEGAKTVGVVQAEDELSAICMVLGAGWAGARAFTATSGPGLSLMGEAAGYSYYTEIPAVIWNVQRVGPSTGMPTRTAQGDVLQAAYLSHGDTKHVLLFPGGVGECFEFGQTCFDLAERLQTLVIVMSELDLGMNLWMDNELAYPTRPMDRGKVLTAQDLEKMSTFYRYEDRDGDGIAARTLPGTRSDKAAYFTRGSGHNLKAAYTERSDEYREVVDRLSKKWETAKTLVPKPLIFGAGSKVGIIAYGTSDAAMAEARDILHSNGLATDYMRIRAFPFTSDVAEFVDAHERIFVVDQNRDGQMCKLLALELEASSRGFSSRDLSQKMISVCHYDGTPITADVIAESIIGKGGQK
jgi:2-oxoglutarate ferredoxin oxidoreductase subunit alpha